MELLRGVTIGPERSNQARALLRRGRGQASTHPSKCQAKQVRFKPFLKSVEGESSSSFLWKGTEDCKAWNPLLCLWAQSFRTTVLVRHQCHKALHNSWMMEEAHAGLSHQQKRYIKEGTFQRKRHGGGTGRGRQQGKKQEAVGDGNSHSRQILSWASLTTRGSLGLHQQFCWPK